MFNDIPLAWFQVWDCGAKVHLRPGHKDQHDGCSLNRTDSSRCLSYFTALLPSSPHHWDGGWVSMSLSQGHERTGRTPDRQAGSDGQQLVSATFDLRIQGIDISSSASRKINRVIAVSMIFLSMMSQSDLIVIEINIWLWDTGAQ